MWHGQLEKVLLNGTHRMTDTHLLCSKYLRAQEFKDKREG